MLTCKECNTEILEGTTAASVSLCIPCSEHRVLFNDESRNIRSYRKHLDGQHLGIEKIRATKHYVEYAVTSALWDNDPRFRSRKIKVGSSTGVLRIYTDSGQIDVVYPLSFDPEGRVLAKAKGKLLAAFHEGNLPEKTYFASG
uniref:hypothetical protein n=1 Tax=Thaumasiovibrio occultus TaxID=1891184 RepID=UPI00131BEDDB|nr:hypothetical protein [Thaumasiovibrio occultus]